MALDLMARRAQLAQPKWHPQGSGPGWDGAKRRPKAGNAVKAGRKAFQQAKHTSP